MGMAVRSRRSTGDCEADMETDEGCVGRVLRGKEREEERGEEERAEKRGEERGEQAAAAAASAGRQLTKDGNHRGASRSTSDHDRLARWFSSSTVSASNQPFSFARRAAGRLGGSTPLSTLAL